MRKSFKTIGLVTLLSPFLFTVGTANAHSDSRYKTFKGKDGRTYCRKSDGTVGAIVGAVGGGLLGNAIAGRGDKTIGTLLGAGAGGVAGRAVERRRKTTCR